MQRKNIVLGAGPAGLFCAHELTQLGAPPIVLEKTGIPGGLAATHTLDGAGFEVGPHIFQADDAYIFQIAKDYLAEDLLFKDWKVQQYLAGQLFTFPNDLANMWSLLGTPKMLYFIFSYLQYRLVNPQDFRSFIYKKVGKALAEFNVLNYTEKMWGLPIDELEYEWIKPRMDRISIWKIIRTAFQSNKRSFYYPKQGAGQLYEKIAASQTIHFEEYPTKIIHERGTILNLETNKGNYEVAALFNSIPLGEFIELLSPRPPEEVLQAAAALKYRSQIYVALLFDQASVIDSQWIYFPEKDIPFCRVHAPGNFSEALDNNGQSTLVFEYFCFRDDPIWQKTKQALIGETFASFQQLSIHPKAKLVNAKVLRKVKAYPLLDQQRLQNLNILEKYLDQFSNLYTMGRHGLHTYDNQHEAGRTGVDAAQAWYSI